MLGPKAYPHSEIPLHSSSMRTDYVAVSCLRFGQLLQKEVLLVCLEKEDPPLTCSVLRLLSHLVRSEELVKMLCIYSDPCVLHTCYKYLVQPPSSAGSNQALHIQLQV